MIDFTKLVYENIIQSTPKINVDMNDSASFDILTCECLLACECQDAHMYHSTNATGDLVFMEGFVSDIVAIMKKIWKFIIDCYNAVVKWLQNMWHRFTKTTGTVIKTVNSSIDAFFLDKKVIDYFRGKRHYKAADGEGAGLMKWYEVGDSEKDKIDKKVFMAHDIYRVVGLNIYTKPWYKDFQFAYSSKDKDISGLKASKVFDELFVDIERMSASKVAATEFQNRIMKTVDPILKWMNANAEETGGFTIDGKYTKSKYILNGLLCHEHNHAIGYLHLPTRMMLNNKEASVTEDINATYFQYDEKMYTHDTAGELLNVLRDDILIKARGDARNATLGKSIEEGGKTFKTISAGYQAVYDNIDKMNSEGKLTFKPDELKKLSLLTSWYTSAIISTFVVADLVVHDAADKIKEAVDAGYKLINFFTKDKV